MYKAPSEVIIGTNKQKAKKLFKQIYTSKKERENKKELLDETLEHIEVCEGMCHSITTEQIRDMLMSRNVIELSRKARAIKFA